MKSPQVSSYVNMETLNKNVLQTNSCTTMTVDVKKGNGKVPVENDEKLCEKANKLESGLKINVPSSILPTDVETDEAPSDFAEIPVSKSFRNHSEDNLTTLLDTLTISPSKSKGEDVLVSKMKKQPLLGEPSCDKVAKELSNLLTTLNIGNKNLKPAKENEEALSVVQKIDEALALFSHNGNVKDEVNKKMKCRGYGETFEPTSPDALNEFQGLQQEDLEDFLNRHSSQSFQNIPADMKSTKQAESFFNNPCDKSHQVTNNSSFCLPPFHENFSLRNLSVWKPPTMSYNSKQSNTVSSPEQSVFGMNETSQAPSGVTNQPFIGVSPSFFPGSSSTLSAKRKKFDPGFQYPGSQYPPSKTNYNPARQNFYSSPPHGHCQPVPSQSYLQADTVSSMTSFAYQPPNSHFTAVQSPSYPAFSKPNLSTFPSPPSSSDTSDNTGCGLSPCPSSQCAGSPRSQSSSPPTGLNFYSPDHSSNDSGICLTHLNPCYPPSFVNMGSPSSTCSSTSQTYFSLPQENTPFNQHTQNAVMETNGNLPRGLTSNQPGVSDSVNYSDHAVFDYTDEDGDCIVHIFLLVYANLVSTGRGNKANVFLNYVAKHLLPNPVILTKLNHQNYKLQTPMYLAVSHNLGPMVDLLIESGADVNIRGRGSEDWVKVPQLDAPLHVAASMGERGLNLVKSLLKSQTAGVNITNTEGETPLHVAAKEHGMICTETNGKVKRKNCISVVQYLLDNGADMEAKEYKCGKTALMFAIQSKDVMLVKTMLDKCDSHLWHSLLNESTNDLNTCMHLAFGLHKMTESKHVELIRLLIKTGGEAEAENSSNQKAKDFAPNVYSKALKIWK